MALRVVETVRQVPPQVRITRVIMYRHGRRKATLERGALFQARETTDSTRQPTASTRFSKVGSITLASASPAKNVVMRILDSGVLKIT
jgi:hypothetical protein